MKIDLHCHTKQIKSGDGEGRNVSPELFREKIINANVKIVAITNHNAFDYGQYTVLRDTVADFCTVWPGVEIDILGSNNKKYHLIVVANPENAEAFAHGVSTLFGGKNLETCKLCLQEVYDNLHGYDVIYISHLHKTPGISEEDRLALQQLVGDPSRVFGETADHRSLGVFANHDFSVLIGSDVKDWNHYEECSFAELRLPVESFSQFCLLAKRDNVVVDTLLNKKQAHELTASPYKNVMFPLKLYADVNIIFGQKGTGKSEILQSLYQDMLSHGVVCEKYTGSERDEDFGDLLSNRDMDRDLTKTGANSCEAEFAAIFEWCDHAPTLFTNYKNWYKTRENNTNKSRMKITETVSLGDPNLPAFGIHAQDHKNVNAAISAVERINVDTYLAHENVAMLRELLGRLQKSILCNLQTDIIEKYAHQLADYSIEQIKLHADKNSDTLSKPSSCGFRDFAIGRLKLRNAVDCILLNLVTPQQNERVCLGELEDKGKIYINKRYRMLCADSKTAEFDCGIMGLRYLVGMLTTIRKDIFSANLATTIATFTEKCSETNVASLKSFLGLSKQIVLDTGDEYKPSNGEKGILLLQQKLDKEADAYFLDEPELGMGNSYIDTNIRPRITALAKRHKVVVVATHNANIAVRTLPYTSIFRVHQNGVYTTYVGNPFNDQLVNIDDPQDVRSWAEESMHTLEGGKEAFYERKTIYESTNN